MKRAKKNAPPPAAGSANPKTTNIEADDNDNDTPLFFYMPDALHGEFCQWFPSPFIIPLSQMLSLLNPTDTSPTSPTSPISSEEEDTITFNCAEQFMMYCKAALFQDNVTCNLVLASPSPKEQKRLGKLVTGFDDAKWDKVKSEVVMMRSLAKYRQGGKVRGKLLGTGERVLVEAASKDRVWGIGYSERRAMDFRRHGGGNRLGKVLMDVRAVLRREAEEKGQFGYEEEE